MAQFLRPNADIYGGGWTPSTGATVYGVIDEAVRDDADYISAPTGALSVPESLLKLSSGVDPGVNTGHVLRTAFRRSGGTSSPSAQLWQGNPEVDLSPVLIATLLPTVTGSFALYSIALDPATEANLITNYGDLYVRLRVGTGFSQTHYCSWCEFEVPDLATPEALIPPLRPKRRTDIDFILLLEATR